MRKIILYIMLFWGSLYAFSQTIIAKQSFEASGDTWAPLNFSTQPCTVGNDVWDYSTSLPGINPNEGTRFWGIRDLDGSCGSNGFESIILPNIDISSFSNVSFSFDYNAINFDNTEDLKYELFYNGISQGEVIVVDGVNDNSDNTNGWLTETVSIPNNVNTVSVILSAKCNRNEERAGFDNIQLFEPASSNDGCSNATTLVVGTNSSQNVVSGTNVGASSSGELPNPSCGNYVARDIWYTAQVPASGNITVETSNSTIDPAIAIYTGTCGNLSQIACNDDIDYPNNLNSRIELTGLPNTTIYVRVWAYNNASSGTFDIVAYSTPSPTNNECSNATNLTVGTSNTENVVTGTNVGATGTNPAPNPNCDGYQGGDVWYTALIPESGVLIVETSDAGGINDTGIAIYTGNCSSLTQIACDADSGPGFFSTLTLTGLPNTTVYIRVWEYQNNDFGEFNIVAYSPKCPFSTTWNGSSWSNGTPNKFTSAILNGSYDTASNGNFDSCNCTINSTSVVNIRANNYILIENDLTVNGTLEVRHEGSLVMVENDGNVGGSGTVNIHKTSTLLNRYDFMYWSSPTVNETIGSAIIPFSDPNRIFRFDNINGWIQVNSATPMAPGVGYIAEIADTGTFPRTQSIVFDGVVNNGIINTPINTTGVDGFNWNLIGNPYPSAISANSLINDPNNTLVNASIYLWTHNTEISENNPGNERYNYSSNDYASYTVGSGGVAAVSGGSKPNGFIASGQAFFIQANRTGNITFNNNMRVTGNNDQLFRSNDKSFIEEKDRVWLELKNDKGAFSQILVGFFDGATDSIDGRFDGQRFYGNSFLSFYSLVEEKWLAIQGRKPILNEDIVKLGFYSTIDIGEKLEIAIHKIEGKLNEYNIYLKDKLSGNLHDLKNSKFEFVLEEKGMFNERFELQFSKSEVLNVDDEFLNEDDLRLTILNDQLQARTTNGAIIQNFKAFDILGKLIINNNPNSDSFNLNIHNINKGTILLINATLENNQKIVKKILVQ